MSPPPPRFDGLSALPRLTARSLGLSLLAQDALFPRIPEQARSALVDAALHDGSARAEAIARELGSDPWIIARRLGVSIVNSDADASFGSVIVFAEYTAQPPRITLYRNAIAGMNQRLAHPLLRVLAAGDYAQTVVAHELYHHLAHSGAQPTLSRRHRVEQFRIGRWRWSGGIAHLEEIAAGAFAKALLGLKFHPRLLELVYALGDPAPRDEQPVNTQEETRQ
jgi:hypothetical protein